MRSSLVATLPPSTVGSITPLNSGTLIVKETSIGPRPSGDFSHSSIVLTYILIGSRTGTSSFRRAFLILMSLTEENLNENAVIRLTLGSPCSLKKNFSTARYEGNEYMGSTL